MATHHAQAVDMSLVIRDKSSDAELRTLAADIIVTQSTQCGIFMGWLQQWGLPQASVRRAWRGCQVTRRWRAVQTEGTPLMHGMASDVELQRLRVAQGHDAEIEFLQLMIRHHEGGVLMARALSGLSRRAELIGWRRASKTVSARKSWR